jgi:hypothetical protein
MNLIMTACDKASFLALMGMAYREVRITSITLDGQIIWYFHILQSNSIFEFLISKDIAIEVSRDG